MITAPESSRAPHQTAHCVRPPLLLSFPTVTVHIGLNTHDVICFTAKRAGGSGAWLPGTNQLAGWVGILASLNCPGGLVADVTGPERS